MNEKRLVTSSLLVSGCLFISGYDNFWLGEYSGMLLVVGIILIAYSVSLTVEWL